MKKKLLFAFMILALTTPGTYADESVNQNSAISQVAVNPVDTMLKLQVMVETFGLMNNDSYPESIYDLKDLVFESSGITSETKNNEQKQIKKVKVPMFEFINDYVDYREYKENKNSVKNKVIYEAIPDENNTIKRYRIFYVDSQMNILIKDNKIFSLSN